MSKRLTRVLSLVLTLVMFLSVSTPAFAIGGGDMGRGFGRDIGENEIRDFEPAGEIAEEEELDYFQTTVEANGSQVTVEAPMGALPTLAELRAEPVEIEDVRAAVESVLEGEANILLAMDISFWLNGIEIEPEEPVRVKISAPELEGKSNLTLVHIPDAAEPETVDLIDEENLSFALGTNEIAFEADSFSTYVVTSGDISATVHWGELNGETFTEFDSSKVVTLDTNASTISLKVAFEGFVYGGADWVSADRTEEWPASATLKKVDGVWQVEKHILDENDKTTLTWADLANGDQIYVYYVAIPEDEEPTPSGADDDTVPAPDTQKKVSENADGTRTITIDVTGTKVTEDNSFGANVLVVLDRTYSMSGTDVSGTTKSRWEVAQDAVGILVDALDWQKNDIEFALVPFSSTNGSSIVQWSGSDWTSNGDTFKTYVNNLNHKGLWDSHGTNWQDGLDKAKTAVDAKTDDSDTIYVIFVTDGEPNQPNNGAAAAALTSALALTRVSKVRLYGVFCGADSGFDTLDDLITDGGGVTPTINGTSASAIEEAFQGIAQTILNDLYANDVSVDDGIPSLSSVSSGVVEGGAGGYEYFRLYPLTASGSNYTYKIGETSYTVTAAQVNAGKDADGNVIEQIEGTYYIEIPWTEGNPGASYNQANGVTWDLSTVSVQPGVTYRLKFKVWPSQEAYDTIADLNNGLITMTQEELDAAGIGGNKEDGYYLLTNTHLKTTYSFKGETYEDEPSETPTSEMILPTTTIKITKIWNNELDARTASDVRLSVTKDGEPYLYDEDKEGGVHTAIPMSNAVKTGENQWTQTNDTDIFISMGQMTRSSAKNEDNTYDIEVISKGHDYTVVEPENFSYRWDLTADIYHPMVINGTPVVLIEVTKEAKALLPDAVKNLAQNKYITNDGKDYYAFNGELYVAQSGDAVLTAVNDRRSSLVINKVVSGETAPADDQFGIKVTMKNPNDPLPGEEGYSDWFHTFWFYVTTEPNNSEKMVFLDDDQVEGATKEVNKDDDGNDIITGYWWFDNGGTVTVYLKAGQYLNFNNLGKGTEYTIEELGGDNMPAGYVFEKVETAADNKVEGQTSTPGTVSGMKVTGTIDKPNTDYSATYTNKYFGFFYVYHSSDCSVQRFPIAENGVAIYSETKTFDITDLVDTDTLLYGGYYSAYNGAPSFNAAAAAALFAAEGDKVDVNGTPYTAENITANNTFWSYANSYKVAGNAMIPESETVYFLKEVPAEKYLRPYLHYTYKTTTGDLTAGWLISDFDDANYQRTGFAVITTDNKAKVCKTLSVTSEYNNVVVKLTSQLVFDAAGYLSYLPVIENAAPISGTSFGANCKVQEFWLTPDGLYVFGTCDRVFGRIGNSSVIAADAVDSEVSSQIYTAEQFAGKYTAS